MCAALRKRAAASGYLPCACRAIPSLDLKFIIHFGEYLVQSVSGAKQLVGSDVNLVHRLLKNSVPVPEYVLMSEGLRAADEKTLGAQAGKLPVVLFTAGGIATPADAAMMMQLGVDGVFVGSGIFKSGNPAQRAEAIVKATTFFDDPDVVAKVSRGLGEAMVGINVDEIPQPHRLAERGW